MQGINRRQFLQGITGVGILSGLGLSSCTQARQLTAGKRPNFLVLITDDQRANAMGAMGNPIIKTPNMDALANDGILFTNAFVTTSICCTSRASIFSGQHASRHGIYNFGTHFTPEQYANTYMEQLRQAGYRVGFAGKYGVGPQKDLPVDKHDFWRGFAGQGRYENKDADGNFEHMTTRMKRWAREFLDGCSSDQPFCLSISFKAPHCQDGDPRQFIYDPKYEDLYKDITIPPPPVGIDQYWEKFPPFFQRNNEGRKRWEIRFSTPELYQQMVKSYYRLVFGVDTVLGQIREQLDRQGLADNTVIILMGDNGFFLGEHGLAGKWYPYEESIRVPLVVYDPRLPTRLQGRRRSEWALNIDLAPTVLSMAGVDVPDRMQGQDLSPLLAGKQPTWRSDFYYDHRVAISTIPQCEALVTERYKYIRYTQSEPLHEELFDLKNDPHEIHNLAGDPSQADRIKKMRSQFEKRKIQAK
ncbi:MAG: sulfatase [Sedimentisphaerales bacterium]|nr:sulfatase [Sedimentisphaerales bacterium]